MQKSYPLNAHVRPQNEETDEGLIRQAGIHAIRFLEHITGLEVENAKCISWSSGLRKKLCKRYLTKLDKAKITGISLI